MKHILHLAALMTAAAAAAAGLIAMRVDTAPVGAEDGRTVMEISIQVAPEDRPRVGPSVWVSGELRRGNEVVEKLESRQQMSAHGELRVEAAWPPGSYELRIDLEGLASGASGFWIGRLEVPAAPPPAAAKPAAATPTPPESPAEADASPPPTGSSGPEPSTPPATPVEPAAPAAPEAAPEIPAAAPSTPPEGDIWSQSPTSAAAQLEGTLVTFFVTDAGNQPVSGVTELEVKLDGAPTIPLAVRGPELPVLLGLAVDLSSATAAALPELQRQLGRLAEQQLARGNDCFLVGAAEAPALLVPPQSEPGAVTAALEHSADVSAIPQAQLLLSALEPFAGQRGRRVLVVLTSGADSSTRNEWKSALELAATAGIPVLVAVIDSDELGTRTLSRWRRAAEVSGGKDYLLQGTDLLRLTLEHFGELIQASQVLALPLAAGRAAELEISAGRHLEVMHSKALRAD